MKFFALLLLALIALFIGRLFFQNMSTPAHLGHQNGQLAAMPSKPNAVSSQTDISEKQVAPLPYKGDAQQTKQALLTALTAMGGNKVEVQESHYIYSIFTTDLLRFHDDVELLLDDKTQQVHFRSQSRSGHSDLGVNRQRYEQFKALYNQ